MDENCQACSKLLSDCECCPRCLKDDYNCQCICETDEDCVKNIDGGCHCRLNHALLNKDLSKIDSYLNECSVHGRIFDTSWRGWGVYGWLETFDGRFINEKFIDTLNTLKKYETSIQGIDVLIQNLENKMNTLHCCKNREWPCKLEYEIQEEIESLRLTQKDYSEIKDTYNWNVYITFKKYNMEYVF